MIAIDPGTHGGVAVALPGAAVTAFSLPATDGEIFKKLQIAKSSEPEGIPPTAYLEELVYFTGKKIPGSTGIKYGASWGKVYGMIFALGFRIILVPPRKWINALGGLGTKGGSSTTEWKNKLKQRAQQLYPGVDITLATADALLILEAAKRGMLD